MYGRFLDCSLGNAYLNVALEEAIFRTARVPAMRVWDNQESVVIGRAQLAVLETDLELCRRLSIPVVRRFTAGGAVYHGPGNVNWSFVDLLEPDQEECAVFDSAKVFSRFGGKVVEALARCSVECRFDPPNRIVNDDGKISGMAAYMTKDRVICHGTLLLSADLEKVTRLTTPAPVNVERRYPRSRSSPVANCTVDRGRFVKALLEATGSGYLASALSEEERSLASTLGAEKYSADGWNLGDPFSLHYS